MICPACEHEIPGGSTFCPPCRERGQKAAGGPTRQVVARVRPVSPAVGADNDPRERSFLIIACLFSAGALAVPRLMRSKAFGPVGKGVLGTVAVVQTALAVAVILAMVFRGPELFGWIYDQVQEHQMRARHY